MENQREERTGKTKRTTTCSIERYVGTEEEERETERCASTAGKKPPTEQRDETPRDHC